MRTSITRISTTVLLLAAIALGAASSCIRPPPHQPKKGDDSKVDVAEGVTLTWDGDEKGGNAKDWANCNLKAGLQEHGEGHPQRKA